MKTLIITIVFTMLYMCNTNNNTCKKCDIELLVDIQENPTKDKISELFCTLSIECKENVEFSEFVNEILFTCLYKYPNEFSKEFNRTQNKKIILINLSSPNSDEILLDEIIDQSEKNDLNKEIVAALKEAKEKYKK